MKIASSSDIEGRFAELALSVFGLSLDTYKEANGGRKIFGYAINSNSRSFSPLFGEPPDVLTSAMNTRFHDTIAGYRVSVQDVFPVPKLNADVLLLSTELDPSPEADFDTILIHEICHLIIDSNSRPLTAIICNEKAKYSGGRLHKKTDVENEKITKHTLEFCTLLAAAAQTYSKISETLDSPNKVVESAMRYDLRGRLRT